MIELDGSQGEGGGQILRTALALSLVTGKPFRMDNIRAKRPKPGLMRQHLACVNAAMAVGGGPGHSAAVNAAGQPVQIGETTLLFTPGEVRAGDYEFAVGSAGSCTLVLQTVLWPLLHAKEASTLLLSGGTHNPMAPSISFLTLLAPYFSGNGEALFDIELRRHGFYPAGGGEARVRLRPPAQGFAALHLMERGALLEAYAECLHAGLPRGVAERELAVLRKGLGWDEDCLRDRGLRSNEGPGNALLAVLRYEHITEVFAAYGDKGIGAEQVARRVLQEVRDYQTHRAPVGPHLADQLMIPMALASLQGRVGRYWATELTEHTRTNARTIETFLPVKFSCEPLDGGTVISLEG
ncbi:RNA 3'-terminal phosphate cyclase [Polaromonas sp. JS666]|uniref:RNA 3'-terminal phosphate cyclase n=1 Tax=Polaromonas sp. (strain JS666 / ATCC BAA-500) TaxID=296591 RepID=UPI0000464BF5|nr:RNA 3'-terminal phosphate cyclase [Polaromonas sp. JS666]ABE43422.1 RNA-3'-phosphate cyclase [Polaromonas sp. JS666]